MKGLQFQRIVLLSDSKKQANQFKFPKRFNLVTGNDNSIGKSTLVKSLFWAIGCEPDFDEEWKSNNVKTLLYFKINKEEFIVSRHKDTIHFGRPGICLKKYPKITGEFSQDFSDAIGFNLLLENRKNGLDCPPPAFYFLPFYIDQKKSWSEPWSGFENLAQYSRFRHNLIKYFCGYLSAKHFEIEEDIYEEKAKEIKANQQIERIGAAIEVLDEVAPTNNIAFSQDDLERIQTEIESELREFSLQQSNLYEQQSVLANDIYDLEQQQLIARMSAKELDEDYKFAVENIPADSLECPLCGVEHDNSLISRAGILADRESLEVQANNIIDILHDKRKQQADLIEKLNFVSSEIDRINDKYLFQESSMESGEDKIFEHALHVVSQMKVNDSVAQAKSEQELRSVEAKRIQKQLRVEQGKLIKKNEKDELNSLFMGSLVENIDALSAKGINLNGVKSPMDYKKILGGGAAEGTRGTLAYQLAVLRQIECVANCELAPFVIDTPNQQEQAEHRYEKVIDAIKEKTPSGYQVIMCAMDNEILSTYKENAHIIELNGDRLLQSKYYEALRLEYEKVILTVN